MYPKPVVDAVEAAVKKYPNSIDEAAEAAEIAIRKLSTFEDVVSQLITSAVRDIVYDVRHVNNVKTKRQTGRYDTVPRTNVATSESVQEVYRSVYDYAIAGMTLGSLSGEDLDKVAASETAIAEGHRFNASLCVELRKKVKDGQQVREVFKEEALRRLFAKVQRLAQAA